MMVPVPDLEYTRLLKAIQPRPIHSKKEHARLLGEIDVLMQKDERKLRPAERLMLELLVGLVRNYEQTAFPKGKTTPAEVLEFLMEQNKLRPADLPLPASRISEILARKRGVSRTHALALGDFFRVSPALFL